MKLWGIAAGVGDELLVYAIHNAKRGIVALDPTGNANLVRTCAAPGAERFECMAHDGETLIVLAHPFDAVLSLFRRNGKATKLQAPMTCAGQRAGAIWQLVTLGDAMYLVRSGGIQRFAGRTIEDLAQGLPRQSNGELGADSITLAWGCPCIDTPSGTYLFDGAGWIQIALPGGEYDRARTLLFDPQRGELWRLGRGDRVSVIDRDGNATTWDAGYDIWGATLHDGNVIAFAANINVLLYLSKDSRATEVGNLGTAPKNRYLLSTRHGVVFCSYDGVVYRSRTGLSDWTACWDATATPMF